MLLEQEKFSLQQSGTFKQNSYKIEANAVTFKMLFKNLYSNIIRAIVREISTNAWDSHVAAGRADVPFHVHLPNHFEPWFSVTDTGTGMPEQFVEEEYTTFFNSNKRGSNDAVGCFGLGAKVPFAYTDSFTVIVRYNGTETTYNPVKNEQGIPTLIKLLSKPTKERNGCEVRFAVESKDFSTFLHEAKEIYRWFKVPPTVGGSPHFSLPTEKYMRQTPEYSVLAANSYDPSYVVMGNVAYPFTSGQLVGAFLPYDVSQFTNWGVRLFMNIGDVQLTPSREALNYDDTTVKNIANALQNAYTDLKAHIYDEVNDAKTLWDARCKLYEISNSFLRYNGMTDNVKWNGQKIEPFVQIDASKISVTSYRSYSYGKQKYREYASGSIDCENVIPKYHNDLELKGLRGLKKYMIEKNINSYIVFTDVPNGNSDAWFKETGLDQVIQKVSSIPPEHFKVIRQKGLGKGKTERSLLYEFKEPTKTHISRANGDEFWTPKEVDMKDGGIYIPISRYYWVKSTTPNELTEHPREHLIKLYRNILQIDPAFVLYGIIPSNMDKLKKFPKWTNLEDYLDKLIKDNIELKAPTIHAWSYDSRHSGILTNFKNIQFHKKSYLGNFVKILKEADKNNVDKKYKAFRDILIYRKVVDSDAMTILNRAQEKIFAKYPLLPYINLNTYSCVPREVLQDYVETIESRNPLFQSQTATALRKRGP